MTQRVKITNVGSLMTQHIIALVINASPHGVVFPGTNDGWITIVMVVFGFGADFGEFLGNVVLRFQAGWGVVRSRMVRRGVGLGNGSRLVFGLVVALKIFPPERSTACVAHETITNPLKTFSQTFPHPIGFSSIRSGSMQIVHNTFSQS